MPVDSYVYNADDHYCYPGSRVLVNLLDIEDGQQLEIAERKLSFLRISELMENPITAHFDLAHLKAIHHYLFQDIYAWAGKVRKGSFLKKGQTIFCLGQHIESYATGIHRQLAAENYLQGLGRQGLIDRLAYYMGEINALHPFREGNGRTQRVYFHQLAEQAGYNLDFDRISQQEILAADIAAFHQDYSPLKELLERSLYSISLD